ncbi:DUF1599 domain-containing protein [Bernardetia sp.]|uniref:DUF1599 domain-containing protein n=1 Tax=Bernardetia sp. TaxID=1937974 RepID=UPI0025C6DE33|nr:DUF1599 domain-containing protein [Bernardetia sp.]
MTEKTLAQYRQIMSTCRQLFDQKNKDYGTSWRILRLPSITDQIYIKAQRIRTIQDKGNQLIEDDIASEFIGIINYALMALIQIQLRNDTRLEIPLREVADLYQKQSEITQQLLSRKNHDYGEAWRVMRISSMTDIILMKLLRIKRIEDNQGKTLVSEGIDAGYKDMINYSVFALILMMEQNQNQVNSNIKEQHSAKKLQEQ